MSSSSTTTKDVARKAEDVAHEASVLLTGQVPNSDLAMGHPIHPATVHWPIAFLSATFSLSALTLLPPSYYPSSFLPAQAVIPSLAHYSAAAGVITAIPAIITGLGEGYELIRAQYLIKGSWTKLFDDAWNMKDEGGRKVKMTVKHASLNDIVVGLAAWNWYRGYAYPNQPLPRINILLGAIAIPGLFYSAMLGGKLVYEYAVGVQRQGAGKQIKEKEQ
nr:uncharacterized protein CI109_005269 [Kwoniella shandongensis]KAA5526313.1 hypothetical protein CI109_005269 [Kwoniella shandongensis]